MDERELANQLKREGFGHRYVWQCEPNARYPEHTHEAETAHINSKRRDDFDHERANRDVSSGRTLYVSPGTVHAAKMGSQGCRHLIGER